ncbi:MAG: Hsp70 family protein [Ruminococcus flavefaciens]|nr:Hsp70 family protein [Ruminococcus flavefaciens]MCM1228578.1 Hsp70 family protein [Ruminococcus flavefaciens]
MATVKIGIDFGTNYTHIGFVHGRDSDGNDTVQSLVNNNDVARGIPSVYYNDGTKELFGTEAVRASIKKPEFGVSSIKRKLRGGSIRLGSQEFQPKDIVQRMLTYYFETAERVLREQFIIDPDSIEVVMTVPVDFDDAEKKLIRRAAESVHLASGTPVFIKYVCPEPVASAVRFLGIRREPDAYTLIFDLGGGTLDIALVHGEPDNQSPYKVIATEGDRELGGDDWDKRIEKLVTAEYVNQQQEEPSTYLRRQIANKARDWKEELSTADSVDIDLEDKGDYFEIHISRQQFEAESADLLGRAMDKLRTLLEKQKDKNIKYIILTGGGSRMPQIQNTIRSLDMIPNNAEIRCFNPEKSIAEGAAVLSNLLSTPDRAPVEMIATHGYGIIYNVQHFGNERMIRIFIKKGDKLPASGTVSSFIPDLPEEIRNRSMYVICETDVMEEGSDPYEKGKYVSVNGVLYTALFQGREVLDVALYRSGSVEVGTETSSTLAMDNSMNLTFSAEDVVNGIKISRDVNISGKNTNF